MDITKERAKEILKQYKKDTALFNWCEEYKSFINDNVAGCISSEVEYILKKSYEDSEAPLSYEDLDLFDKDKAIEHILYKKDNDGLEVNQTEEELREMTKEEIKDLFNELGLDDSETEAEIYEYWIITEPLKYRLEQEGEIFLDGGCVDIWGRQTTGQSIQLDNCCINAFINLLKDYAK